MMANNRNIIKGFTLVELLIAISLIGILTGVLLAVINPRGIQSKARDSQRISDLAKVKVALESYFSDNRKYPNPSTGWIKLSTLSTYLEGSYINKLPADPKATVTAGCNIDNWREYYYKTNAGGTVYVLATNLEIAPFAPYSCPYTTDPPLSCAGCSSVGVNVYYTTVD